MIRVGDSALEGCHLGSVALVMELMVHHLSKLCHLQTWKHPYPTLNLRYPPLGLPFPSPNCEQHASEACEAPDTREHLTHPLAMLHHAANILQRLEVLGVHRAKLHNFIIHLQALKTGEN